MLWTWLRRSGIPVASRLALPAAFLMFGPLAALLFAVSWFSWRIGFGSGHLMRWLSQTAPLDFAGHLLFTARKRARPKNCISHS
jgi:hypothetical protein